MSHTSVAHAAHAVLSCADPLGKVRLTAAAMRQWRQGSLPISFDVVMPARPARPATPELLKPNQMPKRGKGGSAAGRVALIHAIAHIELNAIDLAWDMIGRFGAGFAPDFTADWLSVARDEAKHFLLLTRRLRALGSRYGAFPAHDGLWEAAAKTSHDVQARLAIVPLVLEARGLDVTPQTIERLKSGGDSASAKVLTIIYHDEINHVRIGNQWFLHVCHARNDDPESVFRNAVATYLRGELKPPFNDKARISAGFLPNLYQPLAM